MRAVKTQKMFAPVLVLSLAGLSCNLGVLFSSPPRFTPAPNFPSPEIPTEISASPVPSDTAIAEEGPTLTTAPENEETILIGQPGQGSSVVSPVLVEGIADSTFEQNLVLTLSDEDGDVLATQPTTIQTPLGERGPFSTLLAFSVPGGQAGRISVFSMSAMDGGLEHLASVEVRLLPSGEAQILGPGTLQESIRIDAPAMSAEISGGTLVVSGFSDYYFESNLGLALCGLGGSGSPNPICGTEDNILASGFALIEAPDIGQPGPFFGELHYSIAAPTMARLVVYAASPRDGGLLHAASAVVRLLP